VSLKIRADRGTENGHVAAMQVALVVNSGGVVSLKIRADRRTKNRHVAAMQVALVGDVLYLAVVGYVCNID